MSSSALQKLVQQNKARRNPVRNEVWGIAWEVKYVRRLMGLKWINTDPVTEKKEQGHENGSAKEWFENGTLLLTILEFRNQTRQVMREMSLDIPSHISAVRGHRSWNISN